MQTNRSALERELRRAPLKLNRVETRPVHRSENGRLTAELPEVVVEVLVHQRPHSSPEILPKNECIWPPAAAAPPR